MGNDFSVHKYNVQELRDYVRSELGSGLFQVELTDEQINNAITDALLLYGSRVPVIWSRIIPISPDKRMYPLNHDAGYGVFDVEFITDDVRPASVFYMGLLGDQVPLNSVMLADYDTFLRYRKTMMRATSVLPQWDWLETENALMLYAPVFNLQACYYWHMPRKLSEVRLEHQRWIRNYVLAQSKLQLGKTRSKFQGVLPGPAQNLQLNGDTLCAEAREEIKDLEEYLLSIQNSEMVLPR